MKGIYFHITNTNGTVIMSNVPDSFSFSEVRPIDKIVQSTCFTTKETIRHGCFSIKNLSVYIVSYDKTVTNKILKRYFDACRFFIEHFIHLENSVKEIEYQNFRRLKHNLVTHNTNIVQELEKMFPVESITGASNQIDFIKKKMEIDPKEAATAVLRIIKSANLMKSDIDVYDMLSSPNPYIELDRHIIYKVIQLIINPFWLELLQKEIIVELEESHERALIDFKSMSVVFSHIFDNTTKYIAPRTKLRIAFKSSTHTLDVIFEMTSLKIKPDEIDKIFDENESGEYAKKIGRSGHGIGMHVAKRLLGLNKGVIEIIPNFEKSGATTIHGIPFERNRIIVTLMK